MDGQFTLGVLESSALNELTNIGLGHATTALADITARPLHMSIPYAEPVALEHIPERLSDGEGLAVGVAMEIEGEAEGHILFLLDWNSARSLLSAVIGSAPEDPSQVGSLEASAMLEIGNIINSSFLSAIADMTQMELASTPPFMAIDMAACILESLVVEASLQDHYALAVRTEINDEQSSLEGFFLYMPSVDGLKETFRRLGLPEAA